jgi:hypothetical protein
VTDHRQRRAHGQRGPRTHIERTLLCPDCGSDVVLIEAAPRVYQAEVHHDDSCPWFTALQSKLLT